MFKEFTIKIADHAGACYGVMRALRILDNAIKSYSSVSTFGEIIHNPVVVKNYAKKGVKVINNVDEVKGTIVIRSHGVRPDLKEEIQKSSKVIDATCPFVKKAQLVAKELGNKHKQVLVVGENGHPEVESLVAYAKESGAEVYVVSQGSDLSLLKTEDIGIVSQTTQRIEVLEGVYNFFLKRGVRPEIKNTICSATSKRQQAGINLAKSVDYMIVLGGKNSANTTKLFELCKEKCKVTFHIEYPEEYIKVARNISTLSFKIHEKNNFIVGITAGASTPQNQIEELVNFLKEELC